MFPGFFIGTVFLFLLVRSLIWGPRYGFRRYHAGYGPWGQRGYGPPPWPPWHWGHRQRQDRRWWDDEESDTPDDDEPRPREREVRASGPSGVDEAVEQFVRSLRSRLRATPAQRRAFDAAVARLREATDDFQVGMNEARDDLARALRADTFDELAFEAASLRLDAAIERMRAVARETLVGVHDVLDARQRTILGNLIESRRVVDV